MNANRTELELNAMFVDDDQEVIEQCEPMLPAAIGKFSIRWTAFSSFEEAIERMDEKKYDIVVTDVYKGRALTGRLNVNEGDSRAASIVDKAKQLGFSFIIMYSDGPCPAGIVLTPSLQFVDKSATNPPFPEPIAAVLAGMLESRGAIVEVMMALRKELERGAGAYIWTFLEDNWDSLVADEEFSKSGLERLIRRRASMQINESAIEGQVMRRQYADAYDYYIMPVLPGDLRLGTLLSKKNQAGQERFYFVLTPHCHMVKFGDAQPKADTVLLAECKSSHEVTNKDWRQLEGKKTRIPSLSVGTPEGRYCFLPDFCRIPSLYVDLMQLSSVSIAEVDATYERVALVDSPFAEAVQSCLARFYANVGHRNLRDYTVKQNG